MRSWREEPTREPAHADALGRRLSPSRRKLRERASPIVYWPLFITFPLSRLCPAKGELAPAQILGLGLQDAGWPMQGNGAQ